MSLRQRGRPAGVTVNPGYSSAGSESEPNSPTGFTRTGAKSVLSPAEPNRTKKVRRQVKNYVQEMRKLSDKRRRSSGEENHAAPYAETDSAGTNIRTVVVVLLAGVWVAVLLAAMRRRQLPDAAGQS